MGQGFDWPRIFVGASVLGVAAWGAWYFSQSAQAAPVPVPAPAPPVPFPPPPPAPVPVTPPVQPYAQLKAGDGILVGTQAIQQILGSNAQLVSFGSAIFLRVTAADPSAPIVTAQLDPQQYPQFSTIPALPIPRTAITGTYA